MIPPEASGQLSSDSPATVELGDFEALLNKEFKARDTQKQSAVQSAVRTLAQQALSSTQLISNDVIKSISAIIAELDKKLSEQINLILHNEEFKELESAWRGLHFLVNNTETDETLKIRVLNISKKEVKKTLKKFDGNAWDQSPLFKKLYEDEFGSPGGQPYGCLLGDYYFDHSPEDVKMLEGMAKIGAAMHAPFLSAAAPGLLGMDSWQELSNPRDLTKIMQTAEYAKWRSLRDSDDGRYLGLTMPRTLARLPYGSATVPVDEFAFEEDTEGADHSNYLWSNAAYAMGANITRAFKLYGWCAKIRGAESGGMVEGLPVHTFPTDDGGVDMKCPTEIAITDRREAELAKNGFMPLSHYKNTDYAVFMGAQSVQKAAVYDDPDATANANLAARLPYLFATCRFAHYLKCMVRDKIGSFKEREDMEHWLNTWIGDFCCDSNSAEEMKARYPLSEGKVEVAEIPGNPGYYTSKFFLRPHYQLEGLTVSLRLVSKLPSAKGGG
jgi:type VI secretion system protein ImpC